VSRGRNQRSTRIQVSRNSTSSVSQAVESTSSAVQSQSSHPVASNDRFTPNRRSSENFQPCIDSNDSSPDREEANMRAHMAQSAMSLEMDNDDLIFNMLYFGQSGASIQSMFNTALEETLAAHSTENTPYKLQPATEEALGRLRVMIMNDDVEVDEKECAICQEDMEVGNEIVFMPACDHGFHNECMQRWLKLQNWCPVCRSQIVKAETLESLETAKVNLSAQFLSISGDEEKNDHDERGLRSDRSVEGLLARQIVDRVLDSAVTSSPMNL